MKTRRVLGDNDKAFDAMNQNDGVTHHVQPTRALINDPTVDLASIHRHGLGNQEEHYAEFRQTALNKCHLEPGIGQGIHDRTSTTNQGNTNIASQIMCFYNV